MRLNAHYRHARVAALSFAALFAFGACSSDKVLVADEPIEGVITVDASTQWAYVSLDNETSVTPTPSARQSAAWDIAFNATNVTLNGGEAGPGETAQVTSRKHHCSSHCGMRHLVSRNRCRSIASAISAFPASLGCT